jgi:hypothetical protein
MRLRSSLAGLGLLSAAGTAACGGSIVHEGSTAQADAAGGGGSNDAWVGDGGSTDAGSFDAIGGNRDGAPHGDAGLPGDAVAPSDGGSPPTAVAYRATQANTMASPIPNTCGVTYDGSLLWVLASSGNPQPYALEQFDPSTFQATKTFTLPSLFTTLGTVASGIAWVGGTIWLSVSGDTNSLLQIDPTSGQVLRTMSSPATLGPTDVDFDGTDLWLSSGTGDAYRINPVSGGIDRHFPIAGGMFSRDDGIAYRSGQVFVGGLLNGGMEVYDATSGQDLGAVVHADGSPFLRAEVGPSVFVGNQLVVASGLGITYYDLAPGP